MKDKHIKAYMKCAEAFAECSQSTRLKVGTVIVKDNNILSCGYNALPKHINGALEDEKGNTKPEVRHSEKNALMGLTKSHETSTGATMFTTHSCCKPCSIDIVDAGITTFYFKHHYRDDSGLKHLVDCGVEVIQIGEP